MISMIYFVIFWVFFFVDCFCFFKLHVLADRQKDQSIKFPLPILHPLLPYVVKKLNLLQKST